MEVGALGSCSAPTFEAGIRMVIELQSMSSDKKFQFERTSGGRVGSAELLDDLRRVATEMGAQTIGMMDYRRLGKFNDTTVSRRFGGWNNALKKAGLPIKNTLNIPDETLFKNILTLWVHYGRQPRRSELARPPSTISQSPYNRRFGSWRSALAAFIEFANQTDLDVGTPIPLSQRETHKRTPRDPSLRLRFKVLQRDCFTCHACGASPAKSPDIELHVDHILPWSAGGETTLDNLRTLCSACNLGKGAMI